MKITAEFNSNEELLSFIGAFGAKSFIPSQGTTINTDPSTESKAQFVGVLKNLDKAIRAVKPEAPIEENKVDAPVKISTVGVNGEQVQEEEIKDVDIPKEENKEVVKVTKEMVRERLGAIMKAGKQKEVKALVALHGASKLPDLKEEEYAAVYEEAEVLL